VISVPTSGSPDSSGTAVAFQLVPFPGDPVVAGLTITGSAARDAARVRLHYRLDGPLQQLLLPDASTSPRRLDDLWQSSCLECFLARPGEPGYWEVNIAPAGHWNVYRLEDYRRGLTPEPEAAPPALLRQESGSCFALTVELALPEALAQAQRLEVGITAVIADRDPGEQADFHQREGFALRL
jgi:hypothetical protein